MQAKNLYLDVEFLLVDVMGTFNADGLGYCSMGTYCFHVIYFTLSIIFSHKDCYVEQACIVFII